jgi:hypothetical protein
MEEIEVRTSRTRFLKQLGVTLAAAVGAGVFAGRARATPGQCCYNCGCGGCGGSNCYCHCDCTGIGDSYCLTSNAGCLASGHCISCGC